MDENIGNVLRALSDAGLAAETRVLYTSDHGDNMGARGLWGKQTLYEEAADVPMIMAGPDIPAWRARRPGEPRRRLSDRHAVHGRRRAGSFQAFRSWEKHLNEPCSPNTTRPLPAPASS